MSDPIPLHDELRFPGQHMAPRAVAREVPLSPWGRAAVDQALGKKANLVFDPTGIYGEPMPILEYRALDIDACQLSVTLINPSAIPRALADLPIDIQNMSGEFSNAQVGDASYPGHEGPIVWPPFTAVIRWGTGGARAIAEVDFVNGTVINIHASAVDVFVTVPPDVVNAQGVAGVYTLSGFISPGWPRNGNAQRSINVGAIANLEESAIYSTPKFARAVSIIGADQGGGVPAVSAAHIRFWADPNGSTCVGNYFASGNVQPKFNVPNGGMYFSIVGLTTSTNEGSPVKYQACFDLAI